MAEPGRAYACAFALIPARVRVWLPAAALVAGMLFALAYVLPRAPRNPLYETTVWSLLVLVAFAGWGSLVRLAVARTERVDLGLRIVWGAAALCALGGLLAAFAAMNRTAALLMVESGLGLGICSLALERVAVLLRLRGALASMRREPGLAVLSAVVIGLVALHYVAGISDTHTNPYDDDIAYLAFVRRMLDTGTVLEPFSLRRLSALGGQTLFHELVALRAAPSQGHTFDRSMSVLMVTLLVTGHRAQRRRLPWVVALLVVAFFLILPNLAINTASYYSGVAFFLGLYRTLTWVGRRTRRPWQNALPVALVGAAACTLRQNYIIVPAVALAATYTFHFFLSRSSLRSRLAEPALAAAFSVAALVPWFVVGFQSNLTFFYPVMLGTANPAMAFQSGAATGLREAFLLLWTLLEGLPLKTLAFFVVAAALIREDDHRRPLWSCVLGGAVGLVALVHGITQGDASTLGRYAFGFIGAVALAVVLASCTRRFPRALGREHAAAGLALLGVLVSLVDSRTDLYKLYERGTHTTELLANSAPRSPETDPGEVSLYQRLQASVPAGARVAVMLDEPYNLDYARNQIWNLDMPGYSSLPPGIPYFVGSERLENYFRGLGVRYLAYVKVGYSRYHYRRDYWLQEIVDEQELWRAHAPYVIDFVDNLTALGKVHRSLFEERGLTVIDLEVRQ